MSEEHTDNNDKDYFKDYIVPLNDKPHVTQRSQETRLDDSFFYFSIPGALKHDFIDGCKDDFVKLLRYTKDNNVERKTRVSCEVHSDVIFEALSHDIDAEMNRIRKRQRNDETEEKAGDDTDGRKRTSRSQ